MPADRPASVAAIIPAAGLSRRMGTLKPLLQLAGKPLIAHVLDALTAATTISPIIVVTGHQREPLSAAVAGRDVVLVHNEAYAEGEMLSSIQTGLRALPSAASGIDAVMIALCDQPLVRSQTITQLVTAWSERRPRVLLPRFNGKHGHPIVLSAGGIEEIQSLDGKRGATLKDYTSRHERLDLEVDDPAVLHDIDTPEDFQKAVELLHRSD